MLKFLLTSAILAVLCTNVSSIQNYNEAKVLRITPKTAEHVQLLVDLEWEGMRFWKGPSGIGKNSDLLVTLEDESSGKLENLFQTEIEIEIFIEDVQKLISNQVVSQGIPTGRLEWDQYYQLEDINLFLQNIVSTNSSITSLFSIGTTTEGRDMNVIRISRDSGNATKPVIFIDANIHAREWITSAVATYLINELVNSSNANITSWTEDFDIYILPVLNPDGFEYTHTTDRMWRKSRSNSSSPLGCKGADLNRNFDYNWLGGGSSTNPCVETYAGSEVFSEPETLAVANFIKTVGTNLKLYVSLHSYSQFIMFPFGDTNNTSQYDYFMEVSSEAAAALYQRHNTTFTPGNWLDILYLSTGTSQDWVFNNYNQTISLTYELRDEGSFGFLLPANQIEPSALEFIDSLVPIINRLRTNL